MSLVSAGAIAVTTFVATNVDDLLVLTALFSMRAPAGSLTTRRIVWGQYLGFVSVVGVSVLAAVGLRVVPDRHVHWLGLVPLALGVRGLIGLREPLGDDAERELVGVRTVAGIAALTVANGADNVSVYTPVFRHLAPGTTAFVVAIFLAMLAGWCWAGAALSGQRHVQAGLRRYGHTAVPLVFVVIGVLLLTGVGLG
jgi:cadmium resistance protein CadD (predicted permease)